MSFCCLLMPITAAANDQAYAIFQQGIKLESELRMYEAGSSFREAIGMDPSNSGYREHYAWYLHFNGFPEQAVAAFSDALALKPDHVALSKGKAWNLKVIGQWKESLELYRALYGSKIPTDSMAAAEVKRLLSAENDEKIASLTALRARSPEDVETARELFRTLAYQGRFSESVALGNSIIDKAPRDLPFQLEYARTLSWSGQRVPAEKKYRYLMQQSPDNPFLMLELAQILADDGNLVEALKLLEQARLLQPNSARIMRAEAETLARLGKSSEAIARADAIEGSENDGLERGLARARSRHFSGLLEEAADEYVAALTLYPAHPELLWGLTECATYTGNPEIAADAIAVWRATSPEDARREKYEYLVNKALSPRLAGKFQYYSNSSDFIRLNTGVSGDAKVTREITLTADISGSRFAQSGFRDIYRESVAAGISYRPIRELELSGCMGGNIYDRGDDTLVGMAGITLRPTPGWKLALAWEHMDIIDTEPVFGNAIYNHVVTMGSVGSRIQSDEYSLYLQRDLLAGRLALSGKVTIGDYSDGNLKQSRYAGLSYRLFDVPRLTVGYQYFSLDYRDPAPAYNEGANSTSAYYDPINFEVHTIFGNLSHQFSKTFRAEIEQRVSFIPKSDGTAYAVFGTLEADLSHSVSAVLTYRFFHQNKGIDRTAQSGHFTAQELIAGLTVSF